MKLTKMIAALAVAVGLSACAGSGPLSETPTRNAPDAAPVVGAELTAQSADWRLADVRVQVSGDLRVSEANRYYPVADIVWREDPFGDRRAQVAKIVDDGVTAGLTHLNGTRPVYFDINMHRFHALTEKARYSVGGVHNLVFTLTVIDAATGVALHGPIEMVVDLKAYGGEQAFAAERKGLTQKVRIQSHLAGIMRQSFNGGVEMRVVSSSAVKGRDINTGVIQ
ncbi:DUF6778 family protein [Litoreibacter janthinus]|uniref:Lipoprotein n=1 Tax=Litoreibacter janthinus TaxID=670154 RepID=A0A1I6GPR7_9RHOB|nr:DUF6778 family protein [Litoreibacter janthinus]SFR44099.1 hypothetical protein SAMN04488002_1802 [Litoreibacter janthinus]